MADRRCSQSKRRRPCRKSDHPEVEVEAIDKGINVVWLEPPTLRLSSEGRWTTTGTPKKRSSQLIPFPPDTFFSNGSSPDNSVSSPLSDPQWAKNIIRLL
jgi:hypothetical protein